MAVFLQPKKITVTTMEGEERTYLISKFPATVAREIFGNAPQSETLAEEYMASEAVLLKIMSYVAAEIEGERLPLALETKELVNRHVPDWLTLQRIEEEMLEYNTTFMREWQRLDFLRRIASEASSEDYRNIDSLIGKIIAGGRASLEQLRTAYTLEDAMHIWEAAVVPEYNEYVAVKESLRKAGRR